MSRVSEWESESCESSKSSESSENSESERVWVFQVFQNIPGSQLLSDIQTFFSWEPALWTLKEKIFLMWNFFEEIQPIY